MKDIDFKAAVGDQFWEVKLSWQRSIIGYQIYIDKYFDGTIVKSKSGWVAHFNAPSILTGDDILVLGDMIESVG
jgi:hypothetical protein